MEITLTDCFNESDINELNKFSTKQSRVSTSIINRYPASGGIGWEGVVLFASAGIFTGILNSMGKDLYDKFKEKLFNKKKKLRKTKHRFTINLTIERPGIVFFDLTELAHDEFLKAFDRIPKALKGLKQFKSKGIDATYDTENEEWNFKYNLSQEI